MAQTRAALAGLSSAAVGEVTIAYEPIWAIGTGKNCAAAEANANDGDDPRIRSRAARSMPVLYGGSMKPGNVAAYVAEPNIDGGIDRRCVARSGIASPIIANGARMKHRPLVLAVLDGWGCSDKDVRQRDRRRDASALARVFRALSVDHAARPSGEAVGLPKGIMGNSEVGHMNLGSGRVVPQGVSVIDADIASGDFAKNATLHACDRPRQKSGGTLHFMGLTSDGNVHSSIEHLFAADRRRASRAVRIRGPRFLDGRDTPPRSADALFEQSKTRLAAVGAPDAIASVIGRYYAMDRDKRWERTQIAYDAIARGRAASRSQRARGARAPPTRAARTTSSSCRRSSARRAPFADGDACIFFNFRPDRARQLTLAFIRRPRSVPSFASERVRRTSCSRR